MKAFQRGIHQPLRMKNQMRLYEKCLKQLIMEKVYTRGERRSDRRDPSYEKNKKQKMKDNWLFREKH